MIPFNRPSFDGRELEYLSQAVENGETAGNGPFTKRAEALLDEINGTGRTLLTTSCTHALELAARLLDLKPGDEVIVPAYTFVSSASAFVWNGARPVFADIRSDTLNIDPVSVEGLITDRTRAVCVVHYAGVAAEPRSFVDLASSHGITLIEDNAHGLGGRAEGRALGTFGSLSTLSFHETKNIACGEGGALVVNDPSLIERAEILREKGTDRSRFMRGQIDKYTWVDVGSSWVLSDLLAGVLVGQLERFDAIQQARLRIWQTYHDALRDWASEHGIVTPTVPIGVEHAGHLYYLRLPSLEVRDRFIGHMRDHGVMTVFHYQPLNASPMGRILDESGRGCPNSVAASETLVRLPLFAALSIEDQAQVIDLALRFEC